MGSRTTNPFSPCRCSPVPPPLDCSRCLWPTWARPNKANWKWSRTPLPDICCRYGTRIWNQRSKLHPAVVWHCDLISFTCKYTPFSRTNYFNYAIGIKQVQQLNVNKSIIGSHFRVTEKKSFFIVRANIAVWCKHADTFILKFSLPCTFS